MELFHKFFIFNCVLRGDLCGEEAPSCFMEQVS
jgi:hypothetical protein